MVDFPKLTLPYPLQHLTLQDGQALYIRNPTHFLKVLAVFCVHYADMAQKMAALAEQDAYAQLNDAIHTLKGATGNVGLLKIHELCERYKHIPTADESQRRDLVPQITEQLQNAIKECRDVLDVNPIEFTDPTQLPELLKTIHQQLNEDQLVPINEVTALHRYRHMPDIAKLIDLLSEFELDEAGALIRTLIND